MEKDRIVRLVDKKEYLDSIGLSIAEVKAVNLVISRNNSPINTNAFWS
jgi:hypothetical protein